MVLLSLCVTLECENVEKVIFPSEWCFDVRLEDDEIRSDVTLNMNEMYKNSNSRGESNLVMNLSGKRTGTIVVKSVDEYLDDEEMKNVAVFECRGIEPVKWHPPRGGITVYCPSGTVFHDVDLSESEWVDYDEKAKLPVGISSIEHSFQKIKNK
eukprot:GHVL01002867.1.p2 GENE.GHVL01002867.1~~GHVL01002867.1.p2  ORF type:complete len:154 (-),score=39.36 GHVL01002867.1:1181-1642(-)